MIHEYFVIDLASGPRIEEYHNFGYVNIKAKNPQEAIAKCKNDYNRFGHLRIEVFQDKKSYDKREQPLAIWEDKSCFLETLREAGPEVYSMNESYFVGPLPLISFRDESATNGILNTLTGIVFCAYDEKGHRVGGEALESLCRGAGLAPLSLDTLDIEINGSTDGLPNYSQFNQSLKKYGLKINPLLPEFMKIRIIGYTVRDFLFHNRSKIKAAFFNKNNIESCILEECVSDLNKIGFRKVDREEIKMKWPYKTIIPKNSTPIHPSNYTIVKITLSPLELKPS